MNDNLRDGSHVPRFKGNFKRCNFGMQILGENNFNPCNTFEISNAQFELRQVPRETMTTASGHALDLRNIESVYKYCALD
jgi:hypothetical protein